MYLLTYTYHPDDELHVAVDIEAEFLVGADFEEVSLIVLLALLRRHQLGLSHPGVTDEAESELVA